MNNKLVPPSIEEPIIIDGGSSPAAPPAMSAAGAAAQSSDIPGRMTYIWWRFFQSIANRIAEAVVHSVATGLVATGTTQATAAELTDEWNQVTTTPVNSGVIIEPFGLGTNVVVWNGGANSLKVYPPVGYKIDALATNASYPLAAGKSQIFYQITDTSFKTVQLG